MKFQATAKAVAIFFIIIAAIFGSLLVLDAISMDMFTDSLAKIGGISLIAVATSALISFISSK